MEILAIISPCDDFDQSQVFTFKNITTIEGN
jgi:hypothetical protein